MESLLSSASLEQESGAALRCASSECILPFLAELCEPVERGGD